MAPLPRLGEVWGGLGGWPLWPTLSRRGPHSHGPARTAPQAHASDTKSSGHKSPAARRCGSPGQPHTAAVSGGGFFLGLLCGAPGHTEAARAGPGSRGPWTVILGRLGAGVPDGDSKSPWPGHTGPGHSAAAPAPGRAAGHLPGPAWPRPPAPGVRRGRGGMMDKRRP